MIKVKGIEKLDSSELGKVKGKAAPGGCSYCGGQNLLICSTFTPIGGSNPGYAGTQIVYSESLSY